MNTDTAPSLTVALRIPGSSVSRQALDAFVAYMHDLGAAEADVYVDHDDEAIVLEARPATAADSTQEN